MDRLGRKGGKGGEDSGPANVAPTLHCLLSHSILGARGGVGGLRSWGSRSYISHSRKDSPCVPRAPRRQPARARSVSRLEAG